jgi:hypothetical protein
VEKNNGCMILFGTPEGKSTLGRSACRWEKNTKFAVSSSATGDCGLIHLVWKMTSARLL